MYSMFYDVGFIFYNKERKFYNKEYMFLHEDYTTSLYKDTYIGWIYGLNEKEIYVKDRN